MDRNGKKPKATHDDLHAERSDTKSQTRDGLGRAAADAKKQADRASSATPARKEQRS